VFGFEQEKELIERHNVWLNDELTAKVDSVIELRRKNNDLEDDMSVKLVDVRMPLQIIFSDYG
jgi:nucleoprotein TPR